MIRCHNCKTANLDTSRYCDECGTRLIQPPAGIVPEVADYVAPHFDPSPSKAANTSLAGSAPIVDKLLTNVPDDQRVPSPSTPGHATLVIERGGTPGTEFQLTNDESTIGRWDADNGVFPDIDLDTHDDDAKVSRRHARIRRNNGSYFIEDLGSTNGTYVNRGRRLLPGNTQILNDGDEVIVGKTFLRFLVNH
jgi:hypothetical protein